MEFAEVVLTETCWKRRGKTVVDSRWSLPERCGKTMEHVENDGLKKGVKGGEHHISICSHFFTGGNYAKQNHQTVQYEGSTKFFVFFVSIDWSQWKPKTKRPMDLWLEPFGLGLHRLQFSPSVSRSCPQSKIHWKSKVSIRKRAQ